MYKFWYDCVKPKYVEKVELCNIDRHYIPIFIAYMKTDDIYKDIA